MAEEHGAPEKRRDIEETTELQDTSRPGSQQPAQRPAFPPGPDQSKAQGAGFPQLTDYEILEEIGGGGMGVVYKARHRRLKRLVALKVLKPDRVQDPRAVERFAREMEAIGRLNHPNLINATDAREEGGVHFLVMEHVEGIDVAKILAHSGRLSTAEGCAIIRQAATGLQHAHERGLVHRDIKPSNLMLTPGGIVKVLDLGLARLQNTVSSRGCLTMPDQALGTPDYMAPEQARGEPDIDIRADLYGLGCTLYHLLTGEPPYGPPDYSTFASKVIAHSQEPFPSIRASCPDAPPQLERILDRLTAKDRNRRFSEPVDAANALAPFCADANLAAVVSASDANRVLTTAEFAASPAVRPPPRNVASAVGIIVVAAMVLGLLVWAVCLGLSLPVGPSGPEAAVESGRAVEREVAAKPEASVEQVTTYVRRNRDDNAIEEYTLRQDKAAEFPEFRPLRPDDDFKIHAQFSRPTYWYLVWLDTNGVVQVVARAEQPEKAAEYPFGNQLVEVNPADPAGLHLLMLLVSDDGSDELPAVLEERLADVGAPPRIPAGQYVQLRGTRGPGSTQATTANLDPAYREQIESRLPEGVRWVHQLYLPTER